MYLLGSNRVISMSLLAFAISGCYGGFKSAEPTTTSSIATTSVFPSPNATPAHSPLTSPNLCTPNATQSCQSGNGTGSQTCNSSGSDWSACGNLSSCVSGFALQNGVCISSTQQNLVWVNRPDGSLAQFPGGSVSLAQDQAVLNGANITVYSSTKSFSGVPVTLPVATQAALTSANQTPTPQIPSGLVNSFQISATNLAQANTLGFMQQTSATIGSVPCSGANAILAFGQSNSANSGATADMSPNPQILMFYNGYCFVAQDPLLGASIYDGGGSLWMPFAKRYIADHPGQKIVIASFGVGGSQSADWTSSGVWHSRLVTELNQVKTANLNVVKIFWHQGESDNQAGISHNQYVANFQNMLATLNANLPSVPVSIAVASYLGSFPYNVSTAIQTAQMNLVENNYPNVQLGVVSDLYPATYRSSADLHFNAAGLQSVAADWYQASMGLSQPSFPYQMIETYYHVALQRIGQPSEIAYWQAQEPSLGSFAAIYQAIKNSNEGTLRSDYILYALRLPDLSGFQYWLPQINSSSPAQFATTFDSAVQSVIQSGNPDPSLWNLTNGILEPRIAPLGPFTYDLNQGVWTPN